MVGVCMTQEQEGRQACTVTQAMSLAKRGLEQIRLTVVGEICELSQRSGYKAVYFTIRDDDSVMPCIIWKNVYEASGVTLENGSLVEVTGSFSCYAARGSLQFTVRKLAIAGEGNLRVRVAQLAKKLEAEGLMSTSRKRRIPALPKRIAVITSPSGKAIRDVMRTLRRRYPLGELMVFGVTVEGENAARYMCEALQAAQEVSPAPDVILLVRGGGAYETMMPYNDESLARAVAACSIPVVTGIGHEPDNFIADMVADLRCSTPTAAAEKISLSVDELAAKVDNATHALDNAFDQRMEGLRHRLARLSDRPVFTDPCYLLGDYALKLDTIQDRLSRALPNAQKDNQMQLEALEQRLKRAFPDAFAHQTIQLMQTQERLDRAVTASLASTAHRLEQTASSLGHVGNTLTQHHSKQLALAAAQLDALSPLKTLARGYSISYAQDGKTIVKSVKDVVAGDKIVVRVKDGSMSCNVDSVSKND